jgi:hypothetical protein
MDSIDLDTRANSANDPGHSLYKETNQYSNVTSSDATKIYTQPKPFLNIEDLDGILQEQKRINLDLLRLFNAECPIDKAYITLCTEHYNFGLIGLTRSLRQFSQVPLICMVDEEFDERRFKNNRVYFVRVPRLINERYNPGRKEFAAVLSKFWAFGITCVKKVVFLDADIAVLGPTDDLFHKKSPSFAPDHINEQKSQRFNSGVFVVEPTLALFQDLISFASSADSYDHGDQGVLNEYFAGKHFWFSNEYNVMKHRAFYGKNTSIVIAHYIEKKPWEILPHTRDDSKFVELEDRWTENLERDDLLALIGKWRREMFWRYKGHLLNDKAYRKAERRFYRISYITIAILALLNVALLIFLVVR